jgi:hypothetical protein
MTRQKVLYFIVGAACVAVAILGYQYYESQRRSTGVEIKIDDSGVSIQKN